MCDSDIWYEIGDIYSCDGEECIFYLVYGVLCVV